MYYLNTNTPMRLFRKARNSKIYVDKSQLIEKVSERIDTMDQYICVTRPRRFGKTVNASMLGAYYAKSVDSAVQPELNTRDEILSAMVVYGFLSYHEGKLRIPNRELDENALSCVITLCYLAARDDYQIEREAKSGKGYCDYLFLPKRTDRPGIVLELKVDGTCDDAIRQIKEKGYTEKLPAGCGILLVGISYSKKTKKHSCRIEKWGGG